MQSIARPRPDAGMQSIAGLMVGTGMQSIARYRPDAGIQSIAGFMVGTGMQSIARYRPDAGMQINSMRSYLTQIIKLILHP